jgi:hypothetical protein
MTDNGSYNINVAGLASAMDVSSKAASTIIEDVRKAYAMIFAAIDYSAPSIKMALHTNPAVPNGGFARGGLIPQPPKMPPEYVPYPVVADGDDFDHYADPCSCESLRHFGQHMTVIAYRTFWLSPWRKIYAIRCWTCNLRIYMGLEHPDPLEARKLTGRLELERLGRDEFV